jgi:hypothetical protein
MLPCLPRSCNLPLRQTPMRGKRNLRAYCPPTLFSSDGSIVFHRYPSRRPWLILLGAISVPLRRNSFLITQWYVHGYGTVPFGLSASFSIPPKPALINDVTRHLFVRTSVGSGLLSQPFEDILEDAGSLQSSKRRLTFEGMVRHSRCRSDARIQRNPRCGQSCRRGSRNNRPRVLRTSWAAGGISIAGISSVHFD